MDSSERYFKSKPTARIPRLVPVITFVVIQAGVLALMFNLFRRYFAYYYVVCIAITVVVTVHIVRADTNPAYKIAWILPIMLLPIFGGLFYLVYGKRRPSRREQARLSRTEDSMRRAIESRPNAARDIENERADAALQSRYITRNAGLPPYLGTEVTYFPLGEDMYRHMLARLKSAKKFIFMEYFIINEGEMWGSVLSVLAEKAAEGLDVRLIYDDVGCLFNLPDGYARDMEALGIRCCVFNRLNNIFSSRFNNRDHRKICVIDGDVGYTGGTNLADEYINRVVRFGHWKDNSLALRGDAVWSLTCMFLNTWDYIKGEDEDYSAFAPTVSCESGGYVQPYYDTPLDDEAVGETVYLNLLSRAKRYVYIMTPYLIIDSEMLGALTAAAKSGIDVRIMTPAIPDKKLVYLVTRSYYEPLVKAGVRIFEYSPGFIHSKSFVSDDRVAVVGTINLDFRSLFLHYENAVWLYADGSVLDARDDFLETQKLCREVSPGETGGKRGIKQFFLSILRIFAPLM